MTDWCRLCLLSLGQIAILSVLANSSHYHIWQHLVCNLDIYCGLLPFLANDMSVFVSALSIIVILLYNMVQISPVLYHSQSPYIHVCCLSNLKC